MSRMHYFIHELTTNGYRKCGGTVGAEYFCTPDKIPLGIVVCDGNLTSVASDEGVKRVRQYFKNNVHGMKDNDILVIVFGSKKNISLEAENTAIVDDMGRKIEDSQVDHRFSKTMSLLKKSTIITKEADKKQNIAMHRIGLHEEYTCWTVWGLAVINILFFMNHIGMTNIYGISTETVLMKGQSYRLLTYMFMHGGMTHILMNMISLLYIGRILTKRVGNSNLVIIYLVGGIIGGDITCYMGIIGMRNMELFTVGASGSIFSLLGALLVDVLMNTPEQKKAIIKYCAVTLLTSSMSRYVDVSCHVFGFLGGCLVMYVINMLNQIHYEAVTIRSTKKQERMSKEV